MRRVFLLLLLGFVGNGVIWAQEVLISDPGSRQIHKSSTVRQGSPSSGFRTTTLVLPFFDDFSGESGTPDTNRWAIHPLDQRRPGISIAKGHNVPSKGVATFDGASFNGVKYQAILASGDSDTLTSQPIDLSTFTTNDSVLLSFFVQRGGAGESPDPEDSLVLYFDSTGNHDYVQVWSLLGTGTSENTFQMHFVALDTATYFHSAFRFKFVAYGSLNGELDQFHLDYIVLDAQRSVLDTQLGDASPSRFTQSPMHPFTAMPLEQFQRTTAVSGTKTLVSNAGDPATTTTLSLSIDDPIGGNLFSGTTVVSATPVALAGFSADTANANAFSTQAANMASYGALRLTATRTGAPDQHAENDTVRTIYHVDSILAMDDGVSDIGFGLTNARALCQEFTIDQPDTLVAVWMHFAPTMHFNSATNISTDLLGKGFRLVVWDTLSVDSSLIETSGGMNVAYGSTSNEFIRYQLIKEVLVPTTFWVGLRQTDGMAIGLGFDRNDSGKRIYFENANSEFQLSTNRGTLMIRPEFRLPRPLVGIADGESKSNLHVAVAPNPIHGSMIGLRVQEASALRSIHCELVDVQGRTLQAWGGLQPQGELQLDLATQPAAGIYWLRVNGVDHRGSQKSINLKIIVVGD